jgi:hypothetical protein
MSPSLQGNRSIRVFLSSTLRDMKEEREALMSHTWTALRQFCRETGGGVCGGTCDRFQWVGVRITLT